MKNKIVLKLIMFFSSSLILFSVIIGIVFISLFRNHTIEMYHSEMEKRAISIAGAISSGLTGNSNSETGMLGRQGGFGSYLRNLYDLAGYDVWIVDQNLNLITSGRLGSRQYYYADLPPNADTVVKEVFQGNTTFSEGFSNLLDTPTITVGTPVRSGGKIIGAVLLHSPVEGMNQTVRKGFDALGASMSAALILSVLLSILLALLFTKPLKKMKDSTIRLTGGDYTVKTGVSQKDEIGELAAAIDILSDRLYDASLESEKLMKLRRDFTANISHELRTPVTVIRGSLEALCDEIVSDPEQVKSYHRQMLNESLFLQRLVNDLLDLSRLQNTDFKMEIRDLNLPGMLGDVVRSVKQIAKGKNIDIRYEQDVKTKTISGDYGRLRQMFLIILDNAVKFSDKGGIVIVSLIEDTVFIRDYGIGIPAEDLPYIFDRFYRQKSEQNKSGTGLGLSIAKQIADRHGIKLTVLSKSNEGTEFRFRFITR